MRTRLLSLLLAAALLLACSSKNEPTKLWEDMPSGATVESVKGRLRNTLPKDGWTQNVDQMPAEKGRPAFQFVTLVGPRESYGVDGELTLTFSNDRLMSTSFKANCDEYMSALRGRNITLPDLPSHEVTLDRRTRFRYDEQGTNCRFLWVDPQLEKEWADWSKTHG